MPLVIYRLIFQRDDIHFVDLDFKGLEDEGG